MSINEFFRKFVIFFCLCLSTKGALANGYAEALKYIKEAESLIARQEYQEALNSLDIALHHNQNYGYAHLAHYLKGNIYIILERKIPALFHLEKADEFFEPYCEYECENNYLLDLADIEKARLKARSLPSETDKSKMKPKNLYIFQGGRDSLTLYSSDNSDVILGAEYPHPGIERHPCSEKTTSSRESIPEKPWSKNKITCSIKPGDSFYAHGLDWSQEIFFKDFVLSEAPGFCVENIKLLKAVYEKLPENPIIITPFPGKITSLKIIKNDYLTIGKDFVIRREIEGKASDYFLSLEVKEQKSYQVSPHTYIVIEERFRKPEIGPEEPIIGAYLIRHGLVSMFYQTSTLCGEEKLDVIGTIDVDRDNDQDVILKTNIRTLVLERYPLGYRYLISQNPICRC